LLYRPLACDPEGVRFERKCERFVMVVVMQESDCSHYVRSCSEGKVDQRWKAEGVMMWRKRKPRMGSKTVEGVCFLTNLSLFHEARVGCERRIGKERGEIPKIS
jgi:hypothetical protein